MDFLDHGSAESFQSGTIGHDYTSPASIADAFGGCGFRRLPPHEGIVAPAPDLSSRKFSFHANDPSSDHFPAITPAVISRESHYDQTKPTVTRTVIQAGETYAAKPPGSNLPGGDGCPSGRTFGGHPGSGGAETAGGSAGGSPAAGAPAVVAPDAGQRTALSAGGGSVSIDMALAAEGERLAAAIVARRGALR
jgi:hypothetical protein